MGTLERQDGSSTLELSPRFTVGRATSCDLSSDDPSISAQHAEIRWGARGWLVRDLGSTNGTTLNGKRLHPGRDEALTEGAALRFGAGAETWCVTCDEPPPGEEVIPATAVGGGGVFLADAELEFRVSRDEEHCECLLRMGARVETLGARAHHYTLLTLARARLKDAGQDGLGLDEQGWVYADELARMLGLETNAVNVHLHRARGQLEKVGIADPERLVERRSGPQLRLGTARVTVHRTA